jgi:hypothetical protein
MECFYCKNEISDGSNFCNNCGKAQQQEIQPLINKRKPLWAIALLVIILSCGAAYILSEVQKEIAYKELEKSADRYFKREDTITNFIFREPKGHFEFTSSF